MTLKELNKDFIYTSDKKFDTWEIMSPDKDGKYRGDCEDYALTLKYKDKEFKDWDLWHCRQDGEGHAFLMKGSVVIDNNVKRVVSWETFSRKYTVTNLYKYSTLRIRYELFISKILRWFV